MLECAEISADLDRRMQNVRDVISKKLYQNEEKKSHFLGELILDLISPKCSDYLYIIVGGFAPNTI